MRENKKLEINVFCALMIAAEIILTRFFSVQTPIMCISFGFIPVVFAATMFGPVYGGIVGGISDFIGFMLFPSGPFHPGFTFVAALDGITYGVLLHRTKDKKWSRKELLCRVFLIVLITDLIFGLVLNSMWLAQLFDKGYFALLPARIVKELLMGGIKFFFIPVIFKTAETLERER